MTATPIDIVAWFVYVLASVMFVMGLHYMNSPKTARKGNFISAAGMVIAVAMAFIKLCLLYTSPSPRDPKTSRMPSSA